MLVTVYTDAAFNRDRGVAAWAAWCKSDDGRLCDGGLCHPDVATSMQAELWAAVEGVRLARSTFPGASTVLIVTDCRGIRKYVDHRMRSEQPRAPAMEAIWRHVDETGIRVIAKWTKGHQNPRSGTSAWLNDAVDSLAGEILKQVGCRHSRDRDLSSVRNKTRAALQKRFGVDPRGISGGRLFLGKVLGLKKARVGNMSKEQCAEVLRALGAE